VQLHEADDAFLKKEFLKCIGTCKKERRETKHFLRMAARAVPELKFEARDLGLEARALHLIFAKFGKERKTEMTNRETRISSLVHSRPTSSSVISHSSF